MFEVGNVIKAVEKCPCLWDVSHVDYHNREERNLAWEEVCVDVFQDWDSIDDEERKGRVNNMKKKWNNIRDCYRRDFIAASGTKKKTKYIYTDRLYFLNMRYNGKYENGDRKSSTVKIKQEKKSQDEIDNVTEEILNEIKRNNLNKIAPTQIHHLLKESKPNPVVEDDNTKFLLSFRSDMQRMNNSQKVNFKIGMLQLLKQTMEPPKMVYSSHPADSHGIVLSDPYSLNIGSNVKYAMANTISSLKYNGSAASPQRTQDNSSQYADDVNEIKKKWNNVRDCYRRDINSAASGDTRGRRYVYTDLLSFLNLQIMRSNIKNENTDRISPTVRIKQEEDSQDIIYSVTEEILSEKSRNQIKSNEVNKVTSTQTYNLPKESKPNPVEEDDNIKFLLSFRSDMQRMNNSQKVDFKIGMLQLLKQTMEPPKMVYSSHPADSHGIVLSDPYSLNIASNVKYAMANTVTSFKYNGSAATPQRTQYNSSQYADDADAVKERWNNVRSCYRRYMVSSRSKKVKRYMYTNLLSFLDPNMGYNRSKGKDENGERSPKVITKQEEDSQDQFDDVTEEILNKVKKNKPNKIASIKEEVGIIKVKNRVDLTKERVQVRQIKAREQVDLIEEREQIDIKRQKEQVDLIKRKQFPADEDDNIHFLLSFRNDMKKMTTSQKFDFKIGMLQMMKEIMEPAEAAYSSHRSQSPHVMYSDDRDSPNIDNNAEQAMVNIII